jgi:hypothetical protein
MFCFINTWVLSDLNPKVRLGKLACVAITSLLASEEGLCSGGLATFVCLKLLID